MSNKTHFMVKQGLVQKVKGSKNVNHGWIGGFDLNRFTKWMFEQNQIAFFDECCDDAEKVALPLRYNNETDAIQYYNGTAWAAADLGTFTATDISLDDGLVSDLAIKVGADTNNGFYGISDTQLGAAVEGVLVGGWNTTGLFTNVISEQTGTVGVTVDSVLLKDGGVSNAGATQFAGFYPVTGQQSLSGAGAVNVTSYHTAYTSTGGSEALTLANGTQIGQLKTISHVVDGGSGILTPTSLSGGTTITFTTVAEIAELIWNGTAWVAIKLYNSATPGTPPALA